MYSSTMQTLEALYDKISRWTCGHPGLGHSNGRGCAAGSMPYCEVVCTGLSLTQVASGFRQNTAAPSISCSAWDMPR
jgi:hypothetical protein